MRRTTTNLKSKTKDAVPLRANGDWSKEKEARTRHFPLTRTLALLGGIFAIILLILWIFHTESTTMTLPANLNRETLRMHLKAYSAEKVSSQFYETEITASYKDGKLSATWYIPDEWKDRDTYIELIAIEQLAAEESYDSSCAYFVPVHAKGFIPDVLNWNELDEKQRIGCIEDAGAGNEGEGNAEYASFITAMQTIEEVLYQGIVVDGGNVLVPNTSDDDLGEDDSGGNGGNISNESNLSVEQVTNIVNQIIDDKVAVFVGPQGVRGQKGDQGAKGDTGAKGDPGEGAGCEDGQACVGEPGPQGPVGPQGPAGPQGDKGDTGDAGVAGAKGDQGEKGDTGDTGVKGDQGEKGDAGDAGAAGAKGDKGDQGEKGDQGDPGIVTVTSGLTLNGTTLSLKSCNNGEILKTILNTATMNYEWACATDLMGSAATNYYAGLGVAIDSSNYISIDATECANGEFLTFTSAGFLCQNVAPTLQDNDNQILTYDNTNCKLAISDGNHLYLNCGAEACPPTGALRVKPDFFDPIVIDVSGAVWFRMDGQTVSAADQATYAAGLTGFMQPDGTLPVQQNDDGYYFYLKVFGNCAPVTDTNTTYEAGSGISFSDVDTDGISEINLLYIDGSGNFVFQKGMQNGAETDSINTFEVRDMAANSIFRVDTLNGRVAMTAIEDAYGNTGAYGQVLGIDASGNLKWSDKDCRDDIAAPFSNIPGTAVARLTTNDRFLFTVDVTASQGVTNVDNTVTYSAGQTIPANTEIVVLVSNTEIFLTGDITTDGSWLSQVKFCTGVGGAIIPNGTRFGQALVWDGSEWVAGESISIQDANDDAFMISTDVNDADKTVFNVDSVNNVVAIGTTAQNTSLMVNGATTINGEANFNGALRLSAAALVYDYNGYSGSPGDIFTIDANGNPVWLPIDGEFGDIGDYGADTSGIDHGQVMVYDAIQGMFVPMYVGVNPSPTDTCNTQQNFSITDPNTVKDILVNRNTIQNRPTVEVLKKIDSVSTTNKVREYNVAVTSGYIFDSPYLEWDADSVQLKTDFTAGSNHIRTVTDANLGDLNIYEASIDNTLESIESMATGYNAGNASLDQTGSLFGQIKKGFENISSGSGVGYNVVTQNGVSLAIELLHFYGDYTYSTTGQALVADDNGFAESSATDGPMLVLWFHDNLTVDAGAILTPKVRRKGMTIIVDGKIINDGTISMSARGAVGAGDDIQLLRTSAGTFDTVPAVGAGGLPAQYYGAGAAVVGATGNVGVGRATGGGGVGGVNINAQGNGTRGGSGNGTSYSGGSGGGGFLRWNGVGGASGSGAVNGGVGGGGYRNFQNTTSNAGFAGGGAGNNGGGNSVYGVSGHAATASNGTGGLLNIYAKSIINNGAIAASGSQGGQGPFNYAAHVYRGFAGGGSSGGGSVNLFTADAAGIDAVSLTAAGGASTTIAGLNYSSNHGLIAGGAGGDGGATITYLSTSYYLFEINNDVYYWDAGLGFVTLPSFHNKTNVDISDFMTYGDIQSDFDSIPANDLAFFSGKTVNILTLSNQEAKNFGYRGVPQPQLIADAAPINLGMIETLNDTTLGGIVAGNGNARVVVSANNGANWFTTADLGASWNEISAFDAATVQAEGIAKADFDQMAQALLTVPGFVDTDRLRFAYVLSQQSITDTAEMQYLELNYKSWFSWIKSEHDPTSEELGDYSYTYTSPTTLQVTFHKPGDYKVNIIGQLCNALTLAEIPEGEKSGQTIVWDNDMQTWTLGVGSLVSHGDGGIDVSADGSISLLYVDDATGDFTFKNAVSDSATSFRVMNAGDAPIFNIDTATGIVSIGDGATMDANVIALLLDSSTVAPASPQDGTMYYDTGLAKFRCYEDGAWKDCITSNTIDRPDLWAAGTEYDFENGLYGQRFVGNVVAGADVQSIVDLIAGGVVDVVDVGGWYQNGAANSEKFQLGSADPNHDMFGYVSVGDTGILRFVSQSDAARVGTVANAYDVWVVYVK